jgi:hypothetical protein
MRGCRRIRFIGHWVEMKQSGRRPIVRCSALTSIVRLLTISGSLSIKASRWATRGFMRKSNS